MFFFVDKIIQVDRALQRLDRGLNLKTSLGIAFKPFGDITTHINITFKGAVHSYCDTPLYILYNHVEFMFMCS